jgi:hypothetical protein
VIGYTNKYKKVKGSPSLNWEAYFANFKRDKTTGKRAPSFVGARFDYADEKKIADHYVADTRTTFGIRRPVGSHGWRRRRRAKVPSLT